ncbi:Trypanosomal VSG domain containing protein, putative [Trypanosoma equiperdum]|uniref:Trypanosomal VSG domain containing protein, putative n=1 Tax=Trypanosoma equiperdum TaxID=5694 RepID=A0A1G4HYU1_TRYEQ|nr:Trypanosomal VSG domain containing protein, putative [Trypanosoma equiperdum]
MQATISAVATGVILAIAGVRQAAAVNDGDNAATFGPLCAALQLVDGLPTYSPALGPDLQEPTDLFRLNMSLADADWAAQFTKIKPGENTPSAAEKPTGPNSPTQDDWDRWTAAALFIADGKNAPALKKSCDLDGANKAQRAVLKDKIAELADAANEIYKAAKTEQETKPADDGELTKLLTTGIYGAAETNKEQPENANIFGDGTADYSTACNTGTPTTAKNSLAAAIWCVCGSGSGLNKKPCSKGQTTAADFSGGSNTAVPSLFQHFRQICPKKPNQKITDRQLSQIATQLRQQLTAVGATDTYIGTYNAAGCDAANGGACAKLTDTVQAGAIQEDQIKWLEAIKTVAAKLVERQQHIEHYKTAENAINNLRQMQKTACTRARYNKAQEGEKAGVTAPIKEGGDSKTATCYNHKDNATCLKNNCKWEGKNGKDGECKTKTGAKDTAAGTGEKTKEGAAASAWCATHFNDKDKCEKMNEGKEKPVCAWKKGAEGDKDKEELTFRSTIFLVKKNWP